MSRNKIAPRGSRKRIFIFCEGKKDKSESAYLRGFIRDCGFFAEKAGVQVLDTRKSSGKELVAEAKKYKKNKKREGFPEDEVWVVYDKNGYSKHPQTFQDAKDAGINIAFSSICFEYWILIHFEYTTRPFEKCDNLIEHIKKKHLRKYSKSSLHVYEDTKDHIEQAKKHAQQLRDHQDEANPGNPPYKKDPYTDMDKLIDAIRALEKN